MYRFRCLVDFALNEDFCCKRADTRYRPRSLNTTGPTTPTSSTPKCFCQKYITNYTEWLKIVVLLTEFMKLDVEEWKIGFSAEFHVSGNIKVIYQMNLNKLPSHMLLFVYSVVVILRAKSKPGGTERHRAFGVLSEVLPVPSLGICWTEICLVKENGF